MIPNPRARFLTCGGDRACDRPGPPVCPEWRRPPGLRCRASARLLSIEVRWKQPDRYAPTDVKTRCTFPLCCYRMMTAHTLPAECLEEGADSGWSSSSLFALVKIHLPRMAAILMKLLSDPAQLTALVGRLSIGAFFLRSSPCCRLLDGESRCLLDQSRNGGLEGNGKDERLCGRQPPRGAADDP